MTDWTSKKDACQRVQALIDSAFEDQDPAPWFNGIEEAKMWGGSPRDHKLAAATRSVVLQGLLEGGLVGLLESSGQFERVPAWAWGTASWTMLQPNWPVRLPEDLQWLRGTLVNKFEAEGFERWLLKLSAATPISIEPESFAITAAPPVQTCRELPHTGTIKISECASWVAWNYAISGYDALVAIENGEFGPDGLNEIIRAFDRIVAEAKSERLKLFGRYQARHGGEKTDARPLTVSELIDFGRYDLMEEGLRRGKGYTWDESAYSTLFERDDAFVDIEVQRDQVLTCFGVSFAGQSGPLKFGGDRVPSLPEGAKRRDHQYARFAHEAAKLLREDPSLKRETAFSLVAPDEPMKQPESVRRAIRAAFDLMYNERGVPHQN